MVKVLEGHSYSVRDVAISFDGAKIVTGSSDNTVRVWSTETGQVPALHESSVEYNFSITMR